MASHQLSELDSGTADSITSPPQLDYPPQPSPRKPHDDLLPHVRFMCSFGGQILPRPHDNQLRYVGGDTRIVAVHRSTAYSSLLSKLSKLSGITDVTVKYQLPNEDLDALISVTTDEDVENMMEEYDRLSQGGVNPKSARLRIFLFSAGADSRTSNMGSLLGGSTRREHWFLDALNGGTGSNSLERGRSEASSILSEVPDYLFGFDNSDDTRGPLPNPKLKSRPILADNLSVSDPGSPAPVVSSSPYCSASSAALVPSILDLPPVKTKAEDPIQAVEAIEQVLSQQTGYSNSPVWNYVPESHFPPQTYRPMPVYYMPGSNMQVQHVPMTGQYVQRSPNMGQVPIHYQYSVPGDGQLYSGGMRPVVSNVEAYTTGVIADGVSQQMYYGARTAGMIPGYRAPVIPVVSGPQGAGAEIIMGKISQ